MIEECMTGKIDMIITKSISRFGKNTLDCLKYIWELKEKNTLVFFEKENINTMDSKGEVLLTIMASLVQQESQSLSQNIKLMRGALIKTSTRKLRNEAQKEIAIRMLKRGKMTIEEIAEDSGLSVTEVKQLAEMTTA